MSESDLDKNMLGLKPHLDNRDLESIGLWLQKHWDDLVYSCDVDDSYLFKKRSEIIELAEQYIQMHQDDTRQDSMTIPTYKKLCRLMKCNGKDFSQPTISNTSPQGQTPKRVRSR